MLFTVLEFLQCCFFRSNPTMDSFYFVLFLRTVSEVNPALNICFPLLNLKIISAVRSGLGVGCPHLGRGVASSDNLRKTFKNILSDIS